MIIILGNKTEPHCSFIFSKLEKLNIDCEFLDTLLFPSNILINWNVNFKNEGSFNINGRKINFKDITSVYWRNFNGIKYELVEDGDNTAFLSKMIHRERKSAIHSLFYSLDVNWVNSIKAFELHKKKTHITSLLMQNGIRVPNTLVTNDKESVFDFLNKNNQIIVKPVLGGAFTEKITKENLTKERLDTLSISPVQFQEYIDGVDIRVYSFQNEIYSFRIDTEILDYRKDSNAKLTKCKLPDDVIKDCYKVMKLLDLKYSGIDIRLNKNGEYVFIEANPAPMFIYAEKVTGAPLSDALVKLLVN